MQGGKGERFDVLRFMSHNYCFYISYKIVDTVTENRGNMTERSSPVLCMCLHAYTPSLEEK